MTDKPRLTLWQFIMAFSAVVFMADALNCIMRDHDDWWMPTLLAFGCARSIRREAKP